MECHASLLYNSCFIWVYYIGVPKEADNFTFFCRLFKEGSNNEIIISGPVVPIEMCHLDIMRSTLSFEIRLNEIIKFWKDNSLSFSWDVTVFQRDPDYEPEDKLKITSLYIVKD